MKKIFTKKIVAILLLALCLILTGCENKPAEKPTQKPEATATEAAATEAVATEEPAEMKKIGIIQFAQHGSLDNCRIGIIEGLKKGGFEEGVNLKVDYQNAMADMGISSQIADNFVAAKYDLIFAIATPSAMSAYNAALESGIPVVYSAISDPVSAKLANEDGASVGNITGTSDALPVEEQLKMIREILPEAKKLGIMYTTSEENSLSTIKTYEGLVAKYGFELVTGPVNQTSDIPLAADNILSKVDCLTNLTDNTVVSSLPTILAKAQAKGVPVFGSEIEQVRIGCLAAEGIDYILLGEETGKMGAEILSGEKKAADIPFKTIEKASLYVNKKVAENYGVTLAEETLNRAAEVFEDIK
jgi:putative ABC transport system substrate-binding protein